MIKCPSFWMECLWVGCTKILSIQVEVHSKQRHFYYPHHHLSIKLFCF
jgi:hypothetical protein